MGDSAGDRGFSDDEDDVEVAERIDAISTISNYPRFIQERIDSLKSRHGILGATISNLEGLKNALQSSSEQRTDPEP